MPSKQVPYTQYLVGSLLYTAQLQCVWGMGFIRKFAWLRIYGLDLREVAENELFHASLKIEILLSRHYINNMRPIPTVDVSKISF